MMLLCFKLGIRRHDTHIFWFHGRLCELFFLPGFIIMLFLGFIVPLPCLCLFSFFLFVVTHFLETKREA